MATKATTKAPTKAALAKAAATAAKNAAKLAERQAEERKDLMEAFKRVAEEKNIPVSALIASVEGSLVSAYKKAYGGTGAVRVEADIENQEFRVFAQKLVVQRVLNPNTEIAWRDARLKKSDINLGEGVEEEVTPAGFGRIAAQTAKQVLLQKLREAERVQVASEYANKAGQMFRASVQRMERGDIIVSIGKAEALLPKKEQVPTEHYAIGKTLYTYVLDVRQNPRGPAIKVSRTHPGLVRQLFTLEVPEISDGIVELKAVAREPGQRTKIAVAATNPDVDPVGACIGPRGGRVSKVLDELGNEKVDIVRWSADAIVYITNALSPAQISKVILTEQAGPKFSAHGDDNQDDGEDRGEREGGSAQGTATVIVSEDQQSLAIGKQGQNVRLAARLTGWRIDIRTEKQYAEEQAKRMFDLDMAPRRVVAERSTQEDAFADILPLGNAADDALLSPDVAAAAKELGAEDTASAVDTVDDLFAVGTGASDAPAVEDASTAGLFATGPVEEEAGTETAEDK